MSGGDARLNALVGFFAQKSLNMRRNHMESAGEQAQRGADIDAEPGGAPSRPGPEAIADDGSLRVGLSRFGYDLLSNMDTSGIIWLQFFRELLGGEEERRFSVRVRLPRELSGDPEGVRMFCEMVEKASGETLRVF